MNKIFSNKGHSLIELILVMLLLILFSISTLTLVSASSKSYKDIINNNSLNSDLRIAQSYIYTKVRQNLQKESISLRSYDEIEEDCLVIKDNYSNVSYETIIFFEDSQMKETILVEGADFNPEESFTIISLNSLSLELIEDKGILFETSIINNGKIESLTGFIALIKD